MYDDNKFECNIDKSILNLTRIIKHLLRRMHPYPIVHIIYVYTID